MQYTRLSDQSAQYRSAREELRSAEAELLKQRERVAELRRGLPPGPVVDDYRFREGPADLAAGDEPARDVRLDEMVGDDRSLIIYHLMYGKLQTEPCPMCTMWLDGFDGVAHHVEQKADLVVVAAADLAALRDHARRRGWRRLRLLSAADSTFKYDLGSEDEQGHQHSAISVFQRDERGAIRHAYTAKPQWSEDEHQRGIDLLSPVWNLLDLTPGGRGDWYASLDY